MRPNYPAADYTQSQTDEDQDDDSQDNNYETAPPSYQRPVYPSYRPTQAYYPRAYYQRPAAPEYEAPPAPYQQPRYRYGS